VDAASTRASPAGRVHAGRIAAAVSNERLCSDALELTCWNGETLQLAFVSVALIENLCVGRSCADTLRCKCPAAVVAGSGNALQTWATTDGARQCLAEKGSIYTAFETIYTAERLHRAPIESNGMAEAFGNMLKRDYANGGGRCDAATVLEAIAVVDHRLQRDRHRSSLGYRSHLQYRFGCSRTHKDQPEVSHGPGLTPTMSQGRQRGTLLRFFGVALVSKTKVCYGFSAGSPDSTDERSSWKPACSEFAAASKTRICKARRIDHDANQPLAETRVRNCEQTERREGCVTIAAGHQYG
jgi:hypothetical protein